MAVTAYLPILISAFAFLVSLGSFLLTLDASRKKAFDDQRIMRSSLNDIISKIFAAKIEQAKFVQINPNWMKDDLVIAVNSAYTYQLNSYARLAVYITEKIKNLVSDVEFATIAQTFAGTGDQVSAMQYWEAAIEQVTNKLYEVQYRRDYASYLFNIGNITKGRQEFQKALDLFSDSDDIGKSQNGATYKFWGLNELRAQNKKISENYFAYAEDLFKSISREEMKMTFLTDLAQVVAQVREFKSSMLPGKIFDTTPTGSPLATVPERPPAGL
jgi:tetratricopeptide (TPR) repeat protein